jgi:hypothetical protein
LIRAAFAPIQLSIPASFSSGVCVINCFVITPHR